jgi:DNA mismatch repair protein MutS
LFATHYFEMTQLAEQFSNIDNLHLDATEYQDNIIFMHKVLRGPASQSYGLQVAKLAGVPELVVAQAKEKLQVLETAEQQALSNTPAITPVVTLIEDAGNGLNTSSKPGPPAQADMFAAVSHPVESLLQAKSADDMTPRQALDLVYKLQGLISDS